jgi:DNA-binding response OmpR family regulator
MDKISILWADDEIDLLKPHLLYLSDKGFNVKTVTNGNDAVDEFGKSPFDLVFLDENMPGLSGLETLGKIKTLNRNVPIIMITKSEEEAIMDNAIGSQISDYLIKPVNPGQILLSIKKNIDKNRLISEKTLSNYQQDFRNISMMLSDNLSIKEWEDVYKKLVFWELELEKSTDQSMKEILSMQKVEANTLFSKFIEKNYVNWFNGKSKDVPTLSHTLLRNKVLPNVEKESQPVFLIVIDNLRYDQWKLLQPVIEEDFKVDKEEMYFAILPTCTQYARNSLFAGLMPSEIEKMYPGKWQNDEDEGGKNLYEEEFLSGLLRRMGKDIKYSYNKITNFEAGKRLADNIHSLASNKLNAIVYNFVDTLSHARTEMEVIRELASDDAAYRSLTLSWFNHSPLRDIMKNIRAINGKLIITTDHGTIKVSEPSKVIGDKNTTTNLRYKQGKSLTYQAKDVFMLKNPADAFLPRQHVSSIFLFIKENKFFAYPNNFNYYVSYYRNTFQHGGISLEEMIIPFVHLSPK